MKTEKTEKQVLHFDELNFNSRKAVIKGLITLINDRPAPLNDERSIRALLYHGFRNDSFVSLCEEYGIVADEKLFISAYDKGSSIIAEKFLDGTTPVLKEITKSLHNNILSRFDSVLNIIRASNINATHWAWKPERYVSFENGRAFLANETLQKMQEEFTTFLDSESKEKVFELLKSICLYVNQFTQIQVEKNLIPLLKDENWFDINSEGFISPKLDLLKYC